MKTKALDVYFRFSLPIDLLLIALILFVPKPDVLPAFTTQDTPNNIGIIGNLISTCVALAGFIIAALTVIVTFRSSIAAKGLEEASNALELIVSTRLYPQIVKAYLTSIMEFMLLTIVLYLTWLFFSNIHSPGMQTRIVLSGISATGLTFFRSLWVLIKVLQAEQSKR